MSDTYHEYKRIFGNRDLPRGIPNPELWEAKADAATKGIEGLTIGEQRDILTGRLDIAVEIFKRAGSADAYAAVEAVMCGIQKLQKASSEQYRADKETLPGSGYVPNMLQL